MSEIVVTPVRWNPRGEAEAVHPDRPPLRIWGGIPGEKARVKIVHRGEHSVAGKALGPVQPSPHRKDPGCDKWSACGGCALLHVDGPGQESARRALVAQAFTDEGVAVPLGVYHPSPQGAADFRHVIKLGVGWSDNRHLRVGAWGRGDRHIVPIPQCPVTAPVLRKTMISTAHWIIEGEIWPWDPETQQGTLRAVVLRASRTTGEVLVTFVAGRHTPALERLAQEISGAVSEVVGVFLHINDTPGNAIYTRDEQGVVGVTRLTGKDWIEEKLGDTTYRVGPGDFFQTNPAMAEVLFEDVVRRLDPQADDAIVDLYCGVGGIALAAAREAGFVVGIEEVEGAVQRAKESARINRRNAEFQVGPVLELLPPLAARLAGTGPKVAVNPARRGLEPGVVAAIAALGPERVVYVSCNPRALARDLTAFQALGFTVDGDLSLFDMFPNTPHVETVLTLRGPVVDEPKRRAPRRKVVRGG